MTGEIDFRWAAEKRKIEPRRTRRTRRKAETTPARRQVSAPSHSFQPTLLCRFALLRVLRGSVFFAHGRPARWIFGGRPKSERLNHGGHGEHGEKPKRRQRGGQVSASSHSFQPTLLCRFALLRVLRGSVLFARGRPARWIFGGRPKGERLNHGGHGEHGEKPKRRQRDGMFRRLRTRFNQLYSAALLFSVFSWFSLDLGVRRARG
jgi:hypothetical protein